MKAASYFSCAVALTLLATSTAHAQLSFGFGGSNYGGGHGHSDYGSGGISIGFGSGGISIGSGHQHGWGGNSGHYGRGEYGDGHRHHQPNWGFDINTGSNWGGNQYPQYPNNYQRPARTVQPQYEDRPVVTKPKPTPKPAANVKPAVTDPKDNKIRLVGRHITAEEIARSKEFFKKRLEEFAKTIDAQLPATDADIGEVIAQLVARQVDADLQIRLIDALQAGDVDRAGEVWGIACPGVEIPFGQPRMRVRFASFCDRLNEGTCTMNDVQKLGADLSSMGMNDEPCCGAESLLQDIEEHLRISQAVARAVPGKASLQVAIPAGTVNIAYHPGMADGSVVVLDAETVMVGTGGVGKFEMEQGNVAAAVGYPLSGGSALPDNESKLVRSGVLIENETEDAINYLVDSAQFSIQPGYRQAIPSGTPVVKFDRGNGGKPATYKLASGTYQFTIKNRGFDMVQAKFAVTIDNSQNSEPFHYIYQGEHAVVAAGRSQTHNSNYPIVIRYDRGNGGATKQVLFNESSGTLDVAVNLADNLWDLFRRGGKDESVDALPTGDFAPAF